MIYNNDDVKISFTMAFVSFLFNSVGDGSNSDAVPRREIYASSWGKRRLSLNPSARPALSNSHDHANALEFR
jgi:hypothetical protein